MSPVPLVCLPFAGAGSSFFHSWQGRDTDGIEVIAPQLPGRERRIAEEPFSDVAGATEWLAQDVLRQLGGAGPVLLFGHSLGAVLAYELARRLVPTPGVDVVHLLVSGSPGPATARTRTATGLPDDEFLRRVQEFAGYSHTALEDPEMRELILPTLRADVQMHETYRPDTLDPLAVPITSIRGRDDSLVAAAEADEWAAVTSGDFHRIEVDGGHMYLVTDAGAVVRAARTAAAAWSAGREPARGR